MDTQTHTTPSAAREVFATLKKAENHHINNIITRSQETMKEVKPLTLAEINEKLSYFSNQQFALLTATNYTPESKADLQEYYQGKQLEYTLLQENAIIDQTVNQPIIVSNRSQ